MTRVWKPVAGTRTKTRAAEHTRTDQPPTSGSWWFVVGLREFTRQGHSTTREILPVFKYFQTTDVTSNTIHGVYLTVDATDLPGLDDVPALDLFGTKEIKREWISLQDLKASASN